MNTCSICQGQYVGHGNNAQPVNDGRCCGECNTTVVVPARIKRDEAIIRRDAQMIAALEEGKLNLLEECPYPEKHADGDSHFNCENILHLTPAGVISK